MIHKDKITFNGNEFRIKYFDDSVPLKDFTPYNNPTPKNYNGLIEVFYSPTPLMNEQDCLLMFKEYNNELLDYVFEIINRYPKLYDNFNIERKFYNFETFYVEHNGIRSISKVRRELEIILKEEKYLELEG